MVETDRVSSHDPATFDAAYYDANGQAGDRPALRYYTRLIGRHAPGGPYLDYGCGTGFLVKHLQTLGAADGFEISEYSAATTRRTAPGSTVWTDPDEIPAGRYGGLTAIHVTEHLADDVLDAAVATWARVLRPDGVALVVTPDPAGRARALTQDAWNGFSDPTHINLKPHSDWRRFFEARGFRVVHEGSDGMWNVPYGRLPRLLDAGLRAGPALAQFLSGRLFLAPGAGESGIFVLTRG